MYSFSLPRVVFFHYLCIFSRKALFLTDFPPHPKPASSPSRSAPNTTQPNTSAFAVLGRSQVEPSSHSLICWLGLQQYLLFQDPAVSKEITFWTY